MPASFSPIRRQPRLGAAHRPALTIAARPPSAGGATKHYDAARLDRLTSDWQVSRLSADAELQGKLPIIRDRFRDGERNEPLAENYLFLAENNVIGHTGFGFESKVVLSEELDPESGEMIVTYDAAINREIERGWGVFGRRENFLTTRNMDATAAFKLILRTILRDGDCLIRKVRGYPNNFGFALQLLEPDFLDDQYIDFRGVPCNCPDQLTLPNGRPFPYCQSGMHQVRMGVELHGDWMFPVAYWILADHPGDYFFGNQFSVHRTRVPVDDMIHPFLFKRMGQTRGVPALVAAMLRLQMLGGYDEATLVKARAAAQKIGMLIKEIPDSIADQFADQLNDKNPTMDSEPGGILDLPPGVDFKAWDPQDPSPQYDPFTKRQTRMVAAAGGVSYTSLSNDIENVNFSSIRAGLLEEREGWKGRQSFFIAEVVREIFNPWLPMAILSDQVDVPMSRVDEFTDHEVAVFQGRRWEWVDPQAEVSAALDAIEGGIKTRTDVIAQGGGDFEKVTATLSREKKMRKAADILPDPAPAPAAAGASAFSEDDKIEETPATKGAPDQPRDSAGRYASGEGDAVGKSGDWSSLGLKSAEELPVTERPRRIGKAEALERLRSPYAKEDPLGNAVGFGKRLRDHLEEHAAKGDALRPTFLPHMEAAVEHPAEIWAENTPKGPRLKHIAAFTASNGRKSFAVVSHQVGETSAQIISGSPKNHSSMNKMRSGKLLYQRPPE